ncbi:MAG: hypothetical protein JO112_18565 [Planctomycetes bacterium]|nr:hypothetical protein [Planctomycetota bacterium]
MKRWLTLSVTSCGLAGLLVASSAWAQNFPYSNNIRFGAYTPPPLVSPYLNLLRGGNPAVNYYWGVQVERQQEMTNSQFGAILQDLERREVTGPNATSANPEAESLLPTLPGTGHPTAFMNTGTYFNSGPGTRPGTNLPLGR